MLSIRILTNQRLAHRFSAPAQVLRITFDRNMTDNIMTVEMQP
jgi:hypothetical protein